MAYTPINVPPHPGAEPGTQATAEVWNRYLSLLGLHQAAIIANQKAQYEDACVQAQLAMADALREQGKFTEFVFPPKTRADLIFDMLKGMPQVTSMTELTTVQACERIVDAYIARVPGALPTPAA